MFVILHVLLGSKIFPHLYNEKFIYSSGSMIHVLGMQQGLYNQGLSKEAHADPR